MKETMYVVRVVETATKRVEREFEPRSERAAERLEDGLERNMDHERFHTERVPAK
jgi:hypothetical protein